MSAADAAAAVSVARPPATADRRPRATARLARGAAILAVWTGLGAAVGLAACLKLPPLVGFQVLTVLSGSMEPTIKTGDAVVDSRIAPLDARIGDVVTFRDPKRDGRLVTHRVRSIRADGKWIHFRTQGDANNASERWSVPVAGRIGRVEYRLPKLGYVTAWIAGRYGRILLVVVPALLLAAFELTRLWSPERAEPA